MSRLQFPEKETLVGNTRIMWPEVSKVAHPFHIKNMLHHSLCVTLFLSLLYQLKPTEEDDTSQRKETWITILVLKPVSDRKGRVMSKVNQVSIETDPFNSHCWFCRSLTFRLSPPLPASSFWNPLKFFAPELYSSRVFLSSSSQGKWDVFGSFKTGCHKQEQEECVVFCCLSPFFSSFHMKLCLSVVSRSLSLSRTPLSILKKPPSQTFYW